MFDGTTRLGEAMVMLLHYCLIRLQLLVKSLSGEEIARVAISTLQLKYHIGPEQLLRTMQDRVSADNCAISTVRVLYPTYCCFSHTLDHAEKHFHTKILDEFITAWVTLFSHSLQS